ncbi:MAG TPA: TRAP transporter substrate-binding protein DctP [Candidatus Dormibacteraeota bacterium]|nr:TRAP transporter substrate-binding protein DctP [Candidatus Dormibacteraeota bacterium]
MTSTFAAAPAKIRLATLAPKGSSYAKHLQAMGEKWRQAPGGGVQLTIYPDGTMGTEADMVRRMRLGQLQAAMVTTSGLIEIEPGTAGLQSMPKVFRTLDEVDYITGKLEPLLEKRLEEKGFIVLFWSDTGFVRFFSKQPVVTPDDLRKTKLFVAASRPTEVEIYRGVGCHPVPLEVADILPSLQTGLIDCVCMPPTIALALQLDSSCPNMLDMNWVPLVGAAIITKKAWDGIPAEAQQALRESAHEAGKLIKADGRRENVESVAAMQKRGLKVHTLTPEVDAEWNKVVATTYPKVRGIAVPPDVFDKVTSELEAYRAGKTNAPAK